MHILLAIENQVEIPKCNARYSSLELNMLTCAVVATDDTIMHVGCYVFTGQHSNCV